MTCTTDLLCCAHQHMSNIRSNPQMNARLQQSMDNNVGTTNKSYREKLHCQWRVPPTSSAARITTWATYEATRRWTQDSNNRWITMLDIHTRDIANIYTANGVHLRPPLLRASEAYALLSEHSSKSHLNHLRFPPQYSLFEWNSWCRSELVLWGRTVQWIFWWTSELVLWNSKLTRSEVKQIRVWWTSEMVLGSEFKIRFKIRPQNLSDGHPNGPWYGIQNTIQNTKHENLSFTPKHEIQIHPKHENFPIQNMKTFP